MKVLVAVLLCVLLFVFVSLCKAQEKNLSQEELKRAAQAVMDKYLIQCPSIGSGTYMAINKKSENNRKYYFHIRAMSFIVNYFEQSPADIENFGRVYNVTSEGIYRKTDYRNIWGSFDGMYPAFNFKFSLPNGNDGFGSFFSSEGRYKPTCEEISKIPDTSIMDNGNNPTHLDAEVAIKKSIDKFLIQCPEKPTSYFLLSEGEKIVFDGKQKVTVRIARFVEYRNISWKIRFSENKIIQKKRGDSDFTKVEVSWLGYIYITSPTDNGIYRSNELFYSQSSKIVSNSSHTNRMRFEDMPGKVSSLGQFYNDKDDGTGKWHLNGIVGNYDTKSTNGDSYIDLRMKELSCQDVSEYLKKFGL